jgi:hypothetical protein
MKNCSQRLLLLNESVHPYLKIKIFCTIILKTSNRKPVSIAIMACRAHKKYHGCPYCIDCMSNGTIFEQPWATLTSSFQYFRSSMNEWVWPTAASRDMHAMGVTAGDILGIVTASNKPILHTWIPDITMQQQINNFVPVLCVRAGRVVLCTWRYKTSGASEGGAESRQSFTIAVFDTNGNISADNSYPFFDDIFVAVRFFCATALSHADDGQSQPKEYTCLSDRTGGTESGTGGVFSEGSGEDSVTSAVTSAAAVVPMAVVDSSTNATVGGYECQQGLPPRPISIVTYIPGTDVIGYGGPPIDPSSANAQFEMEELVKALIGGHASYVMVLGKRRRML